MLVRPPDIVVGELKFYRDSSSIFFFFVSYSPSSLNETQPKPAMLGIAYGLKMHVRNLGYPLPLKSGPIATFFDDFAT